MTSFEVNLHSHHIPQCNGEVLIKFGDLNNAILLNLIADLCWFIIICQKLTQINLIVSGSGRIFWFSIYLVRGM